MRCERVLVAVDGGGSRTRLWVLDEQGRLLGQGEAGTSNVTAAGVDAAARAVAQAAAQAGIRLPPTREGAATPSGNRGVGGASRWVPEQVAVAVLALAGADREPEASRMATIAQRLFPDGRVLLVHDGRAALAAGTLGKPGVLLLAGTGALALAVGPQGEQVRAGGWGYLLGDEGSGYWIGREALRAALRAEDGRGPATALVERLCQVSGVDRPSQLVGPVHRGERDRAWVASLVQVVLAAADAGDLVAGRILDAAAGELAVLVRAVSERAPFLEGVHPVPVVTAGGLFRLGGSWPDRLAAALARTVPEARLGERVKQPVVGAAYLALEALYGQVPQPVLVRLRSLKEGSRRPSFRVSSGGRRGAAGPLSG